MSKSVDRILDLIDAGLQTPMPDPTFGEVSPRVKAGCVRCGEKTTEGSDFCDPCRAFLLGDGPDPHVVNQKRIIRHACECDDCLIPAEDTDRVIGTWQATGTWESMGVTSYHLELNLCPVVVPYEDYHWFAEQQLVQILSELPEFEHFSNEYIEELSSHLETGPQEKNHEALSPETLPARYLAIRVDGGGLEPGSPVSAYF